MAEKTVAELESTIKRMNSTIQAYEQMVVGKRTLVRTLLAALSVAKNLADARANWPEFTTFETAILALLQKDSDRVALAKFTGWTRAHEYDLRRAYDEVMKNVKAKREAERVAFQAARDQMHRSWLNHMAYRYMVADRQELLGDPVYTLPFKGERFVFSTKTPNPCMFGPTTLKIQPSYWSKSAVYFPGARVKYTPPADKPWTTGFVGTVIPRPTAVSGYPERSMLTHGLLTYVLVDGTINVRGCFAKHLSPVNT